MKKALILNYHLIDDQKHQYDNLGEIYAVTLKDFEQQMLFLKHAKIKVVSLSNLLANKVDDDYCVALTFDDGNPSDLKLVAPLLQKLGFKATFFLSLHSLEKEIVTWKHYQQLLADGFEIGSHGVSHRDLSSLSFSDVIDELEQSKQIIEKQLQIPISFFSLPFGMYNSKVIQQAKEVGYQAIFTTTFKFVYPSQSPFLVHRWSLKRKTSFTDFKRITQGNPFIIKKYSYFSALKKFILKSMGSNLVNKLHILKNKYF